MAIQVKMVAEYAKQQLEVDGIMMVTIEREIDVICFGGCDIGVNLQTKIAAVHKLMLETNEECQQLGLPEPWPGISKIVHPIKTFPSTSQSDESIETHS
ncbi:hypothetical protein ACFQ4C_17925 [Larkinella insperata]|uniref:Uncharacterized protein n=1 Tax=Larkinella insperata TaxID=332158 RepID=A0ABW3QD80_9BACT|nr:hypothetical protein [Larkinella insperata]